MGSYNIFATYYDLLTENVNYKVRSEYISNFFHYYGIDNGIILDLACGTGKLCVEFANLGYDMIGVDLSSEMLSVARENLSESGTEALLLCQDMRKLDLFGTIKGCYCSLDAINHLNTIEDVKTAFGRVSLFTELGGIFVFDVNTLYKHEKILADNSFVYDTEDAYIVWSNEYKGQGITNITLDIFEREEESYYRYSEEFCERAYSDAQLTSALNDVGFEILGRYNDLSSEEPNDKSQRVYYVCKKTGGIING